MKHEGKSQMPAKSPEKLPQRRKTQKTKTKKQKRPAQTQRARRQPEKSETTGIQPRHQFPM
jgi:hypothetical protein